MKVFVDNFSALAVESCVLGDLANVLSPDTVMTLDEDTVGRIAAETEESLAARRQATEKLQTLNKGLLTLTHFRRHKLRGSLKYAIAGMS